MDSSRVDLQTPRPSIDLKVNIVFNSFYNCQEFFPRDFHFNDRFPVRTSSNPKPKLVEGLFLSRTCYLALVFFFYFNIPGSSSDGLNPILQSNNPN